MTSMLPPARDLPPGRQDEIRVEIEHAVAGRGQRRMRLAPVLAAATAVGAVAAGVVFLAPSQQPQTATQPIPTTSEPTTSAPATRPAPVIPGLSEERIAAIEKGCQESAGVQGTPKLYQHVQDEAGKLALIYTGSAVLTCTLDTAAFPYNSGMTSGFNPEWLPGHFSVDNNEAMGGGDVPGNKPIYRGQRGYRLVAGRVDSKVARVTYTQDGRTIDAKIANNTYVARMVHATTWSPPERIDLGEVKAYDAAGNLLGTNNGSDKCFVNPQGVIVSGGWRDPNVDPKTCEQAQPWR
ncbi:hypothetical protein C8D87_104286 [Lentzea atacamensis]|uniref:Uncharacterized protein n=1 Tax=Lentzea atacamensis TaxID=531938 RepID=A0ABX9E7S1_9PSEU|nr:hypothetical protein [Lentzea atacamensis]RAS65735.1 hypothetical protein C8D87_104286 [Lentzea atacamensis]